MEVYIDKKTSKISYLGIEKKYSYFSYLGSFIRFGSETGDENISLGEFHEVFIDGKSRWKRGKEKDLIS